MTGCPGPKSQLGTPVPLLTPFSFLPTLTDQWGCCLSFPSQVQVMLGITRLDYGRTQDLGSLQQG